ncbi:MAG: class I SAM-dependent methyltransferase [Actinomycetota bacterium]|nr:class I SAM-dependent methyltransferase [Actinomycetota bacterium]
MRTPPDGRRRSAQAAKALLISSAAIGVALGLRRTRASWGPRLFARWYGRRARRAERGEIGQRRRRLVAQASGRVLDLGAGTGESFKHLPSAVSQVVAVEPDPWMLRQAQQRVTEARVPVSFVRAVSDALPFGAGSFDTAVVALVLCTVDDLEGTIAELRRVLRPGGKLLLMEHVRATDDALAQLQDLVARPWSWSNGGCRPNRSTLEAIERGGFGLDGLEWYGYPVLPHVQGVALRT